MQLVSLEQAQQGAKVARSLFSYKGRIAGPGDELSDARKRQAKEAGVHFAWLEAEEGPSLAPAISAELEDKVLELLLKVPGTAPKLTEEAPESAAYQSLLEVAAGVPPLAKEIYDELAPKKQEKLDFLPPCTPQELPEEVGYPVFRLLRVGLYAGWLALQLKRPQQEVIAAIAAGLVCDWLLCGLPAEAREEYSNPWGTAGAGFLAHPRRTFELLQESSGFSSLSAAAVLAHHEHYDGSGFPRAKKGHDIYLLGQIVGAADLAALALSGRLAAQGVSLAQANDFLSSQANLFLSPELAAKSSSAFSPFFPTMEVELSDERRVKVSEVPAGMPSRPVVRSLQEETGIPLAELPNILVKSVLLPEGPFD